MMGSDLLCILSDASSSYSTIKRFFGGSNSYTVLKRVADAETEAAQDLLQRLNEFTDKKQTLNRVLVHLESAHKLQRQSWSAVLDDLVGFSIHENECFFAARYRDMFLCIYIALLHKYLGETNATIAYYLDLAEEAGTSSFQSLYRRKLSQNKKQNKWSNIGLLGQAIAGVYIGSFARIPVIIGYATSGKMGGLIKMRQVINDQEQVLSTIQTVRQNLYKA
jgi:hypothetical protein